MEMILPPLHVLANEATVRALVSSGSGDAEFHLVTGVKQENVTLSDSHPQRRMLHEMDMMHLLAKDETGDVRTERIEPTTGSHGR